MSTRRLFVFALRFFGIGCFVTIAIWSFTGDIERPGFSLHVTGWRGVLVGIIGGLLALALAQYLARGERLPNKRLEQTPRVE